MNTHRGAIGLGLALLVGCLRAGAHNWIQPIPNFEPRAWLAAAYDADRGRVVFMGGDGCAPVAPLPWEYDGTSWTAGPAAPDILESRRTAAAYDDWSHRLVVFGGRSIATNMWHDDTWLYDGVAWALGPAAPAALTARAGHAMAFDGSRGVVVLFGGGDLVLLNDTWELDGAGWRAGPAAPLALVPRVDHALAYDTSRARIVLFGGWNGSSDMNDTWEYDGSSWMPGPAAPPVLVPRESCAMAFDRARGRTVLYGGYDFGNLKALGDTWEYDGLQWRPSPSSGPTPRAGHGMAYDVARGRVVLAAGVDRIGRRLSDCWEYDGATWVEIPEPAPAGRNGHAMAWNARRGRVILFGGYDGSRPLNDTWEFDGAAWRPGPAAPPGLTARYEHAMASDDARDRIVLFGGKDSARRNDTWEYDGASWIPGPAAPASLTPRAGHAMAFDSRRRRTVLFGGRDSGDRNDTWEYDGSAWVAGPAAPAALTPRQEHAMAYDARRGRIVLLGGAYGGPDTWEYDGNSWQVGALMSTGAVQPERHALAFDEAAGKVVAAILGAYSVYEYDGTGWVAIASPYRPALVTDSAMAYDPTRQRMVLFGGHFPGPYCYNFTNATWEYAADPDQYLAGPGAGPINGNVAVVLDSAGDFAGVSIVAYRTGAWGTTVAAGDVDGDSFDEILTGPGPGPTLGPQVRAFRRDGAPLRKINFYAYGTLRYGVNPGGSSIDPDPYGEILTGAGDGAAFGPHVRAFNFDAAAIAPISKVSYYAYATPKYGVHAQGGDADGDGMDEILTGPGPGPAFATNVRGFNYDGVALTAIGKINFDAFTIQQYGAHVAVGDVDRDLFAEIAATHGAGPTVPGEFRGFDYDGRAIAALPGFDRIGFYTAYGGRVALGDVVHGPPSELLGGAGPDPAATAGITTYLYDGATLMPVGGAAPFPTAHYGVNVASGGFGF